MEAGLMEKAFLLTLSTGLLQVVSTSFNKSANDKLQQA